LSCCSMHSILTQFIPAWNCHTIMLIPSEGLTQLLDRVMHFHSKIVKSLVKFTASQESKDYLNTCLAVIVIWISWSLNTLYLVPRHLIWSPWKHWNTITNVRKKMGVLLIFFGRLHTKNHQKPPFSEGIIQKTRKMALWW
jgi:hypothetical protein